MSAEYRLLKLKAYEPKLVEKDIVFDILEKIDRNEYKRKQVAPGVKLTSRAFGKDRRMPITNTYIRERY